MTAGERRSRPNILARLRRSAREWLGRGERGVSLQAYAESVTDQGTFHRTLAAATVQQAPLPRNVRRLEDLPAVRRPWGFSFRDVPRRRIGPRVLARLPECHIVPYRNRWGSEYHAVLTRGGRELRLRGTGPPRNEATIRVESGPPVDVGEAAWIVGRWYRNYYHWVVYQLPRVRILQDQGVVERALIPRVGPLSTVIDDSLRALGVDPESLREMPQGALRADPLWVVESDRFDPGLLRDLRSRLVGDSSGGTRRVHLSREGTKKRRLVGSGDALALLASAGFQTVRPESLSFGEQVALSAESRVLVGTHGAALANMIFMPEGSHVIEFAHPRYPSPAFYALASALGLRYWVLWGTPVDDRGADSLDLAVGAEALERVIARIEGAE
jgi:hypothetical protein